MARYASRRLRADMDCDGWSEPQTITNLTVIDAEPAFTGLLDSEGNEIYRFNDPIGFQFD